MTGKERLEALLRNGKEDMIIQTMDIKDEYMSAIVDYVGAHALLPKGYDKISDVEIEDMKGVLLGQTELLDEIFVKTIIMILAHSPSRKALEVLRAYLIKSDKKLVYFVKCAINECKMWQERI